MPPNTFLMVGGGDDYRPAESCEVASKKYGNGEYMSHQGHPDSFLVADARTKDGTAMVRLALWRCVFCSKILVGLGAPEQLALAGTQEFTWMERAGKAGE